MPVISSTVDVRSDSYRENERHYHDLKLELQEKRRIARAGGDDAARNRHTQAGKMLARERVDALLDPGSPFLEVCTLAGDARDSSAPLGAGLITGIGMVSGRACMIIANDATVKGGTYFGQTCRKHVRAQQIAWQYRLPNLTLVDSGGAFLPEQAAIFPDSGQFGTVFHQIVRQSAQGIPQIASVHGACTAGGAYIPALSDQTIIVQQQGYMHLGGPEIVFAATGERVDRELLGGADMHSRVSGVTDHLADDDRHALRIMRELVRDLPPQRGFVRPPSVSRPPRYDPTELYGIISKDPRIPTNTREILARLVDDSDFDEFKPLYGSTLLCGFARIHGFEVGILANQGVLFTECALKAVHFIDLCCKRNIPLLFMADITGYMVGRDAETGGISKAGAKMITAMSSANVPKYNIIIGNSFGAGYMGMCSRPFEPTLAFGWPNGRAALMGPEQAATTLAMVQRAKRARDGIEWSAEEEAAFRAQIAGEFEAFQGLYNFSSHIWLDDILDPVETRAVMGLALDLSARTEPVETRFGILRM